ncbi:triose-phosphate transporter family-domain-containing protein [Scleroderma yunnanense]
MQNDRSLAGQRGGYQPYPHSHLDGGNTWRNSPEKPRNTDFLSSGLASPFSFSSLLTSIRKYFLRRPTVSHTLKFPPSFSRRTRPLTSTESPFELVRFSFLCMIWYTTSALSSNTGKTILVQFSYPVTLTIIQFAIVAGYCLILMTPAVRFSRMRLPTRGILMTTLPMGAFQVGGHMFSSMAISRIPVSTVHTIKALSPLFTVAAYALLFGVKYSLRTYISLLPLTIGVMLAFTFDVSASSPTGLFCAFGSALVFVSQNIFFKKVMPSGSQTTSQKLDKLNLLLYSSSMAFILMVPIWSFTDLPRLLSASDELSYAVHSQGGHSHPFSLTYDFIVNGTVNFAQNIIAFIILSSTSPVTYSIASLIKRVWVICMAIVWFNQAIHPIQGFGIALTFIGLWMYNSSKGDVEKGEKTMRRVEAMRDMVLPTNRAEEILLNGSTPSSPRTTMVDMNPSMIATGRARSQLLPYAAGTTQCNASGHSQPRNLRIEISSPDPLSVFAKRTATASPTEPYPSPPLSIDSPTSQVDAFGYSTVNPCLSALSSQSLRMEQVSV